MKAGDQEFRPQTKREAAASVIAATPSAALLASLFGFVTATLHVRGQNAPLWIGLGVFLIGLVGVYESSRVYGKPLPRDLSKVLKAPDISGQERIIDIWKQIVDVQMHFNDMLMRTRNYALTLLLASLGAAGVALERAPSIAGSGWSVAGLSLASILLLSGIVGLFAFYFLDRFYYHPLLVASVAKATELEQWIFATNPSIDLTATISNFSRVVAIKEKHWVAPTRIYARNKLTWVYFSLGTLLAVFAWLVADMGATSRGRAENQVTPISLCAGARRDGTIVTWIGPTCTSPPYDSLSATAAGTPPIAAKVHPAAAPALPNRPPSVQR